MKPLKLTMEAFLSYKGKVEIDFNAFDGSVFLIDGDIGSGKTTIFDGIMYALYGVSTGERRDDEELRSHYADKGTETFVELTFIAQGKEYTVRRTPAQDRPKERKGKDGSEFTRKAPTFYLSGGDLEDPLTKKVEVNKKIEELIGLKADQFSQTTLIAQGKFMQLIDANSRDRKGLLSEILATHPIRRFQETLRDKAKELRNRLAAQKSEIAAKLATFDTEDEVLSTRLRKDEKTGYDPLLILDDLLLEMKSSVQASKKVEDEEKKRLDKTEAEYKEAEVKANKAEKDNLDIDTYLGKKEELEKEKLLEKEETAKNSIVEAYQKALVLKSRMDALDKEKSNLEGLNNNLAEETKKTPELQKSLQIATKNNENAPKLDEDRSQEEGKLGDIEKALASLDEKAKLEGQLVDAGKSRDALTKDISDIEASISKSRNEASSIRELTKDRPAQSAYEKAKKETENLGERKKDLESLKDTLSKHEEALSDEKRISDSYAKARKAFDELSNALKDLETRFFDAQAGYLATKLEEGKPCPVCGSTSHPSPAIHGDEVSKEAVDQAKENLDNARENMNDESSKLGSASTLVSSIWDSFVSEAEKLLTEVPDKENARTVLEKAIEDNQSALNKAIVAETEAEKAANKEREDLERADALEKKASSDEERLPELRKKKEDAIAGYNQLDERLKAITKLVGDNDLDDLTKKKNEAKARIAHLKSEIEKLTKALSDAQNALNANTREIERLKKEIGALDKSVKDGTENLEKALAAHGFESREDVETILSGHSKPQIEEMRKEVEEYFINLGALEKAVKEAIEKGIDKLTKVDLEPLKVEKERLFNLLKEVQESLAKLSNRNGKNAPLIKEIEKLYGENQSTFKEESRLRKLSDVANGTLSGAPRVDFETYYQAQVFGQVVEVAGRKFSEMSGGNYELYLHDWRKDTGKENSALDIDVLDLSTNKRRSITSLSGGESFEAALSLALSFADVISRAAGAKSMDCLFIDEGFGSLDNQGLESVVQVIRKLSYESNKTVGIISHVEGLAREIEKKIEVRKDASGSHVKVVA